MQIAMHVSAQVIDHDFGPACGQSQCVLFTQTAAGTGDDGHAAFEVETHDGVFFPVKMGPDAEVPVTKRILAQL